VTTHIKWISSDDPPDAFPGIESALAHPNGLLAAGGDLSPERLLYAYEHAIFPWFDEGQPILWWSPQPRCVLRPERFHVARRLRRTLRNSAFRITFNRAFESVIAACGEHRNPHHGTWITADMVAAYSLLHRQGWAHSVEIWLDGRLAGGVYGVAIGRAFFGESMFSRASDASKTALLALCRQLEAHGFPLLDCQLVTPHLLTLGAAPMARADFVMQLRSACLPRERFSAWPATPLAAPDLLAD
jgi:leucyl/phenylalanyl-tRNA--protein transferase